MKLPLRALLSLCAAITINGCDAGTAQPTKAATSTSTVIVGTPTVQSAPASQTPTPAAAAAAAATTEPTLAAAQPTATPSPSASAERAALVLSPVTLETTDSTRQGLFAEEHSLNLPPGFHVQVFAAGLNGVRWLGLSPEGLVYATVRGDSKVVTLPDADNDGVADSVKTFAADLTGVQGIAFKDKAVYVATEGQIVRLEDTNGDGVADKRDTLADDLPTGGGHSTRTIAFGPDGKLYVSAGSSCNVCVESNEKRAAISRYSADGKFEKVFASGLRNAVGVLFHPLTGELWATNNGRDGLGDDVPPETIYNVKEDANYGWPYCYGDRIPDKTQSVPQGFCEKTGTPAVKMQAHSAPLGLAFYTGKEFPQEFQGDLFVAFHGSWNRSVPTGYKVVRVRMKDNQPDTSKPELQEEDFATGWQQGAGVWGRPVDPMVAPNGNLLLTDDKANAIYSIYYKENAGP